MAGVKATLQIRVDATLEGTADLGTPSISTHIDRQLSFLPGTAATNQADIMWSDTRTLAASLGEDLDLKGTLVNALGATVNCSEVVAIYVEASVKNTNTVLIGNAATNGFIGPFGAATHTLKLAPGEFVLLSSKAGWAVTAGTADLLHVLNGGAGAAVTYNIVVLGRTVAA